MNTTKPTEYVSDEDKDIIENVCLELVAVDNETDDDAALAANTNFSEVVTPEESWRYSKRSRICAGERYGGRARY